VIMNNQTGSSYKIWFTGLVRNQQIFSLQPATNQPATNQPTTYYLSASAPIAGTVASVTGYVGRAGDIVKFWSTNSQSYLAHTNVSGTWSNGGLTNILNVGEGFVLISTNSYVWTNSWP
jgi:hypothetical protein